MVRFLFLLEDDSTGRDRVKSSRSERHDTMTGRLAFGPEETFVFNVGFWRPYPYPMRPLSQARAQATLLRVRSRPGHQPHPPRRGPDGRPRRFRRAESVSSWAHRLADRSDHRRVRPPLRRLAPVDGALDDSVG